MDLNMHNFAIEVSLTPRERQFHCLLCHNLKTSTTNCHA